MASAPSVRDALRRDVATCGLADRVAEASARAEASGLDVCVVVNDQRIVLGLLRRRELDADPNATAEQVMRSGPTTYRLDDQAAATAKTMRDQHVDLLTVTTPDGALAGVLRREDAERAARGILGGGSGGKPDG